MKIQICWLDWTSMNCSLLIDVCSHILADRRSKICLSNIWRSWRSSCSQLHLASYSRLSLSVNKTSYNRLPNQIRKNKKVPQATLLVTSLYTNIPHKGINAAILACEENDSISTSTRVITKFLSLILNLNNFIFNDENIVQIKGCSMGSKCLCSYTNLFMGKFEKGCIYSLISNKCICYFRIRDRTKPLLYQTQLCAYDHQIQKCKYSNKEINFLNTNVCISRSNTLITKLYKKETDWNAYLHYKSYHPCKLKENIPYGQFLRIKRICTNNNDAEDSMNGLKSNFTQWGYPEKSFNNN